MSCDIIYILSRIKYSASSTVRSVHQEAPTTNGECAATDEERVPKAAAALRGKSRFQGRARRERSDVTKAEEGKIWFSKEASGGEPGADVKWGGISSML